MFKVGDIVRTKEDHGYLNISILDILTVVDIDGRNIFVKFKDRTLLFQCEELVFGSELNSSPNVPTGIKHDQDKPDMSLLSNIALTKVAQVMTYGKAKYSAHNWRGGFIWSRPLAAAARHLFAYIGGEDKDPETGLSHLAHCACCLMFLLEFEETHKNLDDRFKQDVA